jgi:hypothetical protein
MHQPRKPVPTHLLPMRIFRFKNGDRQEGAGPPFRNKNRRGCPVLLALSARELALSGAEGAGNLISYPAFLFWETH